MNKWARLLKQAEIFYKDALQALAQAKSYSMSDEQDLISESENYDIKDEELYNQFESFMNAYKELVDVLHINPENLTQDRMDDAAQLIDVLNKRYERILNNQYLNVDSSEGYEEDFDPGELTSFIQKVEEDAENRLKAAAGGQDINIDEMRSAQYAQEFNQQMIDKGDKSLTFTGDKVQQLLEARRNWFKNLMFIKKVGKSHPEYERFERYIQVRHKIYKDIMNDPVRAAHYRMKGVERQAKYRVKLEVRKKELLSLRKQIKDAKKLADIDSELALIEKQMLVRKSKKVQQADKVREKKESGTLEGLIIHLQQRLATQKNEVAKAIKKKAATDPFFNTYKQAVKLAKDKADTEPSPANQSILEEAIKAEAAAIKNYLDEHPLVIQVKNDMATLYEFRDQVKVVNDMISKSETVSPDIIPIINQVINDGGNLTKTFGHVYKSPTAAIKDIISYLSQKISE